MDEKTLSQALELKRKYDILAKVLDDIWEVLRPFEEIASCIDLHGNPPSLIFKSHITPFLMYMSASDGLIHDNEVEFIDLVLGYDSTPESVKECIIKNNLYSEKYEREFPTACEMAVAFERLIEIIPGGKELSLSEHILDFYQAVGMGIAMADGDFSVSEKRDLDAYTKMLREGIARSQRDMSGED